MSRIKPAAALLRGALLLAAAQAAHAQTPSCRDFWRLHEGLTLTGLGGSQTCWWPKEDVPQAHSYILLSKASVGLLLSIRAADGYSDGDEVATSLRNIRADLDGRGSVAAAYRLEGGDCRLYALGSTGWVDPADTLGVIGDGANCKAIKEEIGWLVSTRLMGEVRLAGGDDGAKEAASAASAAPRGAPVGVLFARSRGLTLDDVPPRYRSPEVALALSEPRSGRSVSEIAAALLERDGGSTRMGEGASMMASGRAESSDMLVGKTVIAADGGDVGEIEDVVRGADGEVEAVVVSVGGFLGIGENRVALPFDALRSDGMSDSYIVSAKTREEIEALPRHELQN